MIEPIEAIVRSDERADFIQFLYQLRNKNKSYLLRNDIMTEFSQYCASSGKHPEFSLSSHIQKLIYYTQEIILDSESYCLVVRFKIGHQQPIRIMEDLSYELMTSQDLLDLRDRLVNQYHPESGDLLELDFRPFYDYSPLVRDAKNIGNGVQFLNRYLPSRLFQAELKWQRSTFSFLSLHSHNGMQLLINDRIQDQQHLSEQVKGAIVFLDRFSPQEPFNNFRFKFQEMGFEAGWGNTAGRVKESLELLDSLIDSPDHQALEAFLSRIPMLSRIVLVSPHGWFGQEGVLGKPDTGGQVVYVLDQARSLEKQLKEDWILAGIDPASIHPKIIILTRLIPNSEGTRCNERLEKVYGTDNVWILRVPFREFNPKVTQNWISRFEIWPYLETYAIDSERELLAEFQGKPDLIIGNYSDGNLVAFLLSRKLGITQCNIAHALEKPKYLFSNLYWQDLESNYHFSLQFTADLLAMNAANFIVSSTYQEIIGTPDSVGQYESYQSFTMPGLYHVVSGIELFSPKFNVVPPGVNEHFFFPYNDDKNRLVSEQERLTDLLFTLEDSSKVYGKLSDPKKRPIFSMARLDRIKNLTGLVQCFGESQELQDRCNLILIAGKLRVEDTSDKEEADEIVKLYRLIEKYNLYDKMRWLGVMLPKGDSGEIYRIIADHQGIFVQPALFEAFGLTILESMITGLPTFATEFGGPREIIQDGVNGFLINPTHIEETGEKINKFLDKCEGNPDYWKQISEQAIQRVYTNYTWPIHTNRLLSLARIYGFWNHTSKENREELMRYIESLFYLLFKPRAQELLQQHYQR
ncbi:MAG: Sucrose synthase [Chroococcopsis gigantea SAG 12.99]|jgi:sucrose synthase|nr:sucrose synthase [Chlorogloea purpurea SAG 13.99]MDV3000317.1 Sucrose synthase [Chroococcopsis gigantea SAG 12.99]